MTEEQRELVELYRATPTVLRGLLRNVLESDLRRRGTDDDAWSIIEVVCHLRDAEASIYERVRCVQREERHFAWNYDPDALAESADYLSADLGAALDAFEQLRIEHAAFLTTLTADEWHKTGVHEVGGEYTILELTRHMGWHDMIHLAQIARKLLPASATFGGDSR
jgi:hypothetical protein